MDADTVDDLRAWTFLKTRGVGLEGIEPRIAPDNAPMSSAPFVYREDGRPDWGSMWDSFCELALYGGPPHRGPDDPVHVVPELSSPTDGVIMELRRGIFETTGLFAEPALPGWLAITCHSKQMAAWMCAAIILENVDARCEDDLLFVPASTTFELKNEVKKAFAKLLVA
jgi:sirohydrochlorin cobaltochelatase